MHRSSRLVLTAAVAASGALGACTDSTGSGGARAVSLSFSTAPATASGTALSLAVAPDPLVITKAQLVLSKTELQLAGASCANDVENDDDGCAELEMGPMLIDLPVDAATKAALTVTLPAGTYSEFEARVDAITSPTEGPGQDAATFLAAHPEFRNVSVRVEGTYNGQPFVFMTDLDADLEIAFSPPLVVDATSSNVTVHVDLASWFRAENGAGIDPATANTGGVNKSVVEGNIKRSFKVFEDDDRDGRDD